MNPAMPNLNRRAIPSSALMIAATILVALAALTGCSEPESQPQPSNDTSAESEPETPEELYFYAVDPETRHFDLLQMQIDSAGQITGTHTNFWFSDYSGTEDSDVKSEFVGARTDDSFEFEKLNERRTILTGTLENGVLTTTGGYFGSHDKWTQIDSTEPFEDMLDIYGESIEGCGDEGYAVCNEGEWPTALPSGD